MELKPINDSLNLRELYPKEDNSEELKKKEKIKELEALDQKVRQHELAHKSAGGDLAGPPNYSYTIGPDGKKYAIGGEVSIDVSPEPEPEATIRKMRRVIRAALAPMEPSATDISVAMQATQVLNKAQAEANQNIGKNVDKVI